MKAESKVAERSGQQRDNVIEKDPVCGMDVSMDSLHQHSHAGTTYRFCSQHCLHKFRAAPDKYLAPPDVGAPADSDSSASAGVYTCPMDPEVEQQGPGSCPKCGMALEPMGAPVAATKTETMPTDACLFYYECEACQTLLRPKAGDCCVFCSYGTVPCPLIQLGLWSID